jgi:hypothetical protein
MHHEAPESFYEDALNARGFMAKRLLTLTFMLSSLGLALSPLTAQAETLLTQAKIQAVRGQKVDFISPGKPTRMAAKNDVMVPKDALRTYRSAMAELRFNDRSLARIGENALFNFTPNTRTLDLRRGTVLLLIQPGQGRTRVTTPNAAAGIRGSALFIRHIEDTSVTIVGALTNSDIEVTTKDGSQSYTLKAGQMAYVFQDRIGVYPFDQKKFQETSSMFREVEWTDLQAVRAEIDAALSGSSTVARKYDTDTPDWLKTQENRSVPPGVVAYDPTSASPGSRTTQPPIYNLPDAVTQPNTPSNPPPTGGFGAAPPAEPPSRGIPTPVPTAPTRPTPTPISTPNQAPNRPTPTPLSTPNQPQNSFTPPAVQVSQPVLTPPSPPVSTPPTSSITPPVVTPPAAPTSPSVPSSAAPPTRPVPSPGPATGSTPPTNSAPTPSTTPSAGALPTSDPPLVQVQTTVTTGSGN